MEIHGPNPLNWVAIILQSRLTELMLTLGLLVFCTWGITSHIHHLLKGHLGAFLFWSIHTLHIWLSLHQTWLRRQHLVTCNIDLGTSPHVTLCSSFGDLRQISRCRCCCVELVWKILRIARVNDRSLALIHITIATWWVEKCPSKLLIAFFLSIQTFWARSIFGRWILHSSVKLWSPRWDLVWNCHLGTIVLIVELSRLILASLIILNFILRNLL